MDTMLSPALSFYDPSTFKLQSVSVLSILISPSLLHEGLYFLLFYFKSALQCIIIIIVIVIIVIDIIIIIIKRHDCESLANTSNFYV